MGETEEFCNVDEKPFGPVHAHKVALLELGVNVADPVLHIGPLFEAPVEVGIGLTTTVEAEDGVVAMIPQTLVITQ